MRTHALTIAATLSLLAASSPALADGFDDGWEPDDHVVDYSDGFVGQFTGVDARLLLSNAEGTGLEGWGVDAGVRFAFPIYLGDFRLSYRHDALGAPGVPGGSLTSHSVGGNLAFHPLYLFLLGSDWLAYVAGSFYLDAGFGGQYVTRELGDESESSPAFFWNWGAGVDVPLLDPDVGWAPWLNVSYRNHRGLAPGPGDALEWTSTHSLMLGIGFRVNRLLW